MGVCLEMNPLHGDTMAPTISFLRVVCGGLLSAGLLASGCIVGGSVGDDPQVDESATSAAGVSSTSGSPGFTSAPPDGGGEASVGGIPTGTATSGPLGEDEALEACGVPVLPPPPRGPSVFEFIECSGGCTIQLELPESIELWNWGDCLCAAMQCGEFVGGGGSGAGSTSIASASASVGGDTEGDTDGGVGCGPFPSGDSAFTCDCEACSVDVSSVDATWLRQEADLLGICECMCSVVGCGAPI